MEFMAEIKNPLLIPEVFERVAHFIPFEDIETCREVCQQWEEEISRVKKSAEIVNGKMKEPSHEALLLDHWILRNQQRKNDNHFLISISELSIKNSPRLLTDTVAKVMEHFGDRLDKITLEDCRLETPDLYDLLSHARANLHTLVVKKTRRINTPYYYWMAHPLDLLCLPVIFGGRPPLVFPNLKVLSVRDPRPIRELHIYHTVFPNLEVLEIGKLGECDPINFNIPPHPPQRWNNLQTMDLSLGMEIEGEALLTTNRCRVEQIAQLESLAIMGLPALRTLTLRNIIPETLRGFPTCYRLHSALSNLLDTYRLTLESLTLLASFVPKQGILPPPFFLPFPQLHTLEIDTCFILSSFRFIDFLPNLKRLVCRAAAKNWISWAKILQDPPELPLINGIHFELQELSVGAIDGNCSLLKLGILFPNLVSLELADTKLDDHGFRNICGSFPNLHTLKVTHDYDDDVKPDDPEEFIIKKLTDVGITGMKYLALKEDDERVILREKPNILDLKELKVFEIHHAPFLTDISVFHGVSSLPRLQAMSLPPYGCFCGITDKCLMTVFGNLELPIDYQQPLLLRRAYKVN